MCKHKSGGMSKPPGAATSQSPVSSRSTSSYPSHNCHTQTEVSHSSVSPNESVAHSLPAHSDVLFHSHLGNFNKPALSEDAVEKCPSELQKLHLNDVSSIGKNTDSRSAFRKISEYDCNDSSDSDDNITECSPMLLTQPNEPSCSLPWTLNSNISQLTHYRSAYSYNQGILLKNQLGIFMNSCDKTSYNSYPLLDNFKGPNLRILPSTNFNCESSIEYDSEKYPVNQKICSIPSCETRCMHKHCNSELTQNEFILDNIAFLHTNMSNAHVKSSKFKEVSYIKDLSVIKNCCIDENCLASEINTDAKEGPSGLLRPYSINCECDYMLTEKDEYRCRSYSLTPTVNFAVFESESASENESLPEMYNFNLSENHKGIAKNVDESLQIPVAKGKVFSVSPSVTQLSLASSCGESGASICKICHMTAKENDPLISPCRCSGTMQYIHCGCLMKWLEISSKRSRKPAICELCQYQYHWHKKFKVRHWQFPHCSRRDKVLHFLFFISMVVMIACATVTIVCFKHDKGTKARPDRAELTYSEIVTLTCGVMFFLAFFVAMYVEVKSRNTIYKLLVKFIYLNQQWYIDEYEKRDATPVAV